MRRISVFICIFFSIIGFHGGKLSAEGSAATNDFIEFFVGACLRGLPDIERMKVAARLLNWKKLEGDMATLLAPEDDTTDWQGWLVPEEDNLFMFGVSEGMMNRRKVFTCVAVAPDLDQEDLVYELQSTLNLKLIIDKSEALQRVRGWRTKVDGKNLIVNLTTLSNSRVSSASLAGIALLK